MARIEIKGREFQKKSNMGKMLEIRNEYIVFGDSEKYCCLKCFFFSNYDECEIRLG